eukprot:11219887-Lingulodinium_polyedra.AAC.1
MAPPLSGCAMPEFRSGAPEFLRHAAKVEKHLDCPRMVILALCQNCVGDREGSSKTSVNLPAK